MRFRIVTTKNLFGLGLAWSNNSSHEYRLAIFVACISLEIFWKKPYDQA